MQKPDPDDDVFDKEIQEAQAAQRDGKSEAEEDLLKEARTNHLQEQTKDLQSYRGLREKYASKVMDYLIWYSCVVLFLVIADAGSPDFNIPENAVVTLVGSTAIAAIGLVGFVVKGLFPNEK